MSEFRPFAMERWQSTHENRVAYNLSESGVHPMTLAELAELAGGAESVLATGLGYGQSNGNDELRALIAGLYDGADDGNVVTTNGSAEANFVAMWSLVRPGDEVAVFMPAYMQTHGLAYAFGASVREIWAREELGWQPDPDEVRDAVEGARVVVVTNPGNPTGVVLSDEVRRAVVEGAARSGTWILADEVYAGAEVDGPPTPSLWNDYDRVVATGSLSKAYGLPGLRFGWLVAPHETAYELWSRTDYTSISTGHFMDTLATHALGPDVRPRIIERTRGIIRHNLAIMTDWMDRMEVFRYQEPDAGAIVYARYDLAMESEELAERLRVEQDLLIVPGAHYLMGPYVRFGFGLPAAELEAALARFGNLIQDAKGANAPA
jgi:aspartate/methionine/tyrosine aminotransferase